MAQEPDAPRRKSVSDYALRLTPDESDELMIEINEIVERWRQQNQGGVDDDRITYSVYQLIQPYPEPDPEGED